MKRDLHLHILIEANNIEYFKNRYKLKGMAYAHRARKFQAAHKTKSYFFIILPFRVRVCRVGINFIFCSVTHHLEKAKKIDGYFHYS